ncbi:3'-5' ssDNA/RNA exonuclease tatd [Plakobranchus ocellatus]|uniref:3'-5' ssDNA/RNA exonuclease tatd n=1 Tax=Plakobranchus ocellatus TaxID=259542 RepID=A0AAV3Z7W7_9GAST|nr:3'-5' ssDNA/RNA exonuclease tatd [Plakobranchus ocellatus]
MLGQGHAGRDCDVTSGTTRLRRRESFVLIQPPKIAVYISKLTVDVPGFVATIGVHPRHILSWNAPQKEAFKILVRSPNTKALGEIGLDFTAKGIKKQEEVLKYLLRGFLNTAKPVILHLRGRKGHEDEAHNRGVNLAGACLPREQPIQLDCFSGGADIAARWQRQFPNLYMSFSGLVDSFNEHQKRGLQGEPANRLLLETDQTPNAYIKGRVNTPHRIGEVTTLVSQVRQEPLSQVLETTNVNFRGLFHL